MKKHVSVFLAVCLLFALSGCAATLQIDKPLELVVEQGAEVGKTEQERLQKAVELFESSTDHTPVGHLLTQEYTAEAANFVADWRDPALLKSFCMSLDWLNDCMAIEVLRCADTMRPYVVYRINDGGWLYVFLGSFEGYTGAEQLFWSCVTHTLYVDDKLDATALRGIQVGDSYETVCAADPSIILDSNGYPQYNRLLYSDKNRTVHRCGDDIYVFTYDDNHHTVTGVEHYPDGRVPYNDNWAFDYTLLPIDKP